MKRDNRINAELERVSVFFDGVDENKRSIVSPLLQNYAFMTVTLFDLQQAINKCGYVETYQNGEHQSGIKQSAPLQAYNSMLRNYAQVTKQLTNLLPNGYKPLGKLQSFIDEIGEADDDSPHE